MRSIIRSKASLTSCGVARLSRTPPTSDLWTTSGERIFMATGKPIFSAASTASSADAADGALGHVEAIRPHDLLRGRLVDEAFARPVAAVQHPLDAAAVDGEPGHGPRRHAPPAGRSRTWPSGPRRPAPAPDIPARPPGPVPAGPASPPARPGTKPAAASRRGSNGQWPGPCPPCAVMACGVSRTRMASTDSSSCAARTAST